MYLQMTLHTTKLIHIAAALGRFSGQRKVILVGDLNLNLDSIESTQDMEIANVLADSRSLDMHHYFKHCRHNSCNTWHQKREGEIVGS